MQTDQQQKVKVDIKYLQPGWVVDQPLFSGSTLLLKSGTVISDTILSLLSRRGIKYLSVSKGSTLSEFGEVPTSGRFQKSRSVGQSEDPSITPAEILASHKIVPVVSQPVIESAALELDRVFVDAAENQKVEIDQLQQVVDPVISTFLERPTNSVMLPDQIDMKTYAMNHGLKVGLFYMVIAQDWCSSEQCFV